MSKTKKKIFGVHPVQKKQIRKYCLKCGSLVLDRYQDKFLGIMYPCLEEHCKYEEDRALIGKYYNKEFWARSLRE